MIEGLRVNEETIAKHVAEELPYLSLERAMMLLTENGVDRQIAHEKIRQTALKAKDEQENGKNITVSDLLTDDFFKEVSH